MNDARIAGLVLDVGAAIALCWQAHVEHLIVRWQALRAAQEGNT